MTTTIRAVAEAMVAADRGRDCDPDVRDDYDADDGSDWDGEAIADLVREVATTIEDGEAWATAHREAVLDAYRAAWRAAVEADLAERASEAEALAERQWWTGYDAALTAMREGRADGPCEACPFPLTSPFHSGICQDYAAGYNAALAEAAEEEAEEEEEEADR